MLKHKETVFIVFLAVIVFGIFSQTLKYELVWDDAEYLQNDAPFFAGHAAWESFRLGFFVEGGEALASSYYYRPVVIASFMLERSLWGLKPWSMRLVNVILFALALVALYRFLLRQSEKPYFAEIATLLFALNPLNVDNIVWIVGRCDLLLLLWGALAFLALARYADRPKASRWILSTAAFALGVFSKESFVFFLPALLVYEFVRRKRLTAAYHLGNLGVAAAFFLLKNGVLGIGSPALHFLPGLGKNVPKILASAGYYARSIFLPVAADRFLPDAELATPEYFYLGIGLALFLTILIVFSFRNKSLALPTALMAGFVAGALGLAFARFISYPLYARYMMIPALGATWLIVHALGRLKEWLRFVAAFAILLLFIPSVVLRALDYRTNLEFFQKAESDFPEEGYLSYQVAAAYHAKTDYLNTELALQRAMRRPLDIKIVASARLLMAQVEFNRADYPKSRRWVESLGDLPPEAFNRFLRFQAVHQTALVALSEGDATEAEGLFRVNIDKYPERWNSYRELAHLYLGREEWDKAEEVEKMMKDRFGKIVDLEAARVREEFRTLSEAEKADFYSRHRNYARAIEILRGLPSPAPEEEIGLVRLLFRAGREFEARETIDRIAKNRPGNVKAWNAVGMLYLREFLRVEDALACFRESLRSDRNQPEVAGLAVQLSGYLRTAQPLTPPPRQSPRH